MTDKTMRRFSSAPTIAATPLAAALLVLSCATAEAAEAGWLQKGGKMWVKNQIESYVKPNVNAVGTLANRLVGIFNNASGGDGDMDAVNESMGQFIKEAVPVVNVALNFGEAVINAPENLKDMLKSAERKVWSVVRRTGEAAVDPIAALAFPSKSDREYASRAGLFDKKPLPTVRVVAAMSPDPRSAAGGGATDSAAVEYVWDAKGTGIVALPSDWRDRRDPWGAAPTAATARSPDPWGPMGGGVADGAAGGSVWDAKGTGVVALPSDWQDRQDPWGAAPSVEGAAAGGDAARDEYAAALAGALGDDPAVAAGDDYQGALDALGAREAERRRLAEQRRREEAERRQAEAAHAERLKREREAREREERRLAELEERRIREQTARNNAEAWNAVMGSLTGLVTGYVQVQQMKAERQRLAMLERERQAAERRRRQAERERQRHERQAALAEQSWQQAEQQRRQAERERHRQQAEQQRRQAERERHRQQAEQQRREAERKRREKENAVWAQSSVNGCYEQRRLPREDTSTVAGAIASVRISDLQVRSRCVHLSFRVLFYCADDWNSLQEVHFSAGDRGWHPLVGVEDCAVKAIFGVACADPYIPQRPDQWSWLEASGSCRR